MNLKPSENTSIYGYKYFFNEIIQLYNNRKMPNKILLSGKKGSGKSTFAYHLVNFFLSKDEELKYDLIENKIKLENLKNFVAIIGEAPNLKDWEFFAAKPARDWDYVLEMYDSFMVKQRINIADWEYLFRMTPNFKIRILIYAENIDFLDEDDKRSASDFVVNSIIGEADKIDYIDSIEFISFVNETQDDDIKSIVEMRFEFEQLLDKM
jgi:septin family protein